MAKLYRKKITNASLAMKRDLQLKFEAENPDLKGRVLCFRRQKARFRDGIAKILKKEGKLPVQFFIRFKDKTATEYDLQTWAAEFRYNDETGAVTVVLIDDPQS